MPRPILVHETPIDALVEHVEREGRAAIDARGTFSIALPGGSVATEGFPRLAVSRIDWSRVDFFWGDERVVPKTHPDSNYGVARSLLLTPVRASPDRVYRMPTDREDLSAAARAYERDLRRIGIDLALLGVGPDGHVCSLFPGHPLLEEKERWVLPIEDSPKPPPRRLTLTLPALAAARCVVIVGLGAAKARVVKAAVEDDASELPLALVLRRAPRAVLIVDPAAASALSGADSTP
jgi:6-phosphogluconolactonase